MRAHNIISGKPIIHQGEHILKKKRLFRRVFVYVLGLFILALGIAFTINSALGISSISLIPFVVSKILGIYMGICVTGLFVIFILLQIIILRKEFKLINLTQLAVAYMFGFFVDTARLIVGDFYLPTYAGQLLMLAIGISLIVCGLTLYLEAKLISKPPEGLILALVQKIPNSAFHRIKIIMDSTLVTIGIILSLVFLGGFYGIREGTLISAILIGKLMPLSKKCLSPFLRKIGLS
jgi:uncharacterized membrane protein YczE